MSDLHPTTQAVWRAVAAFADEHGYPPTIRDISAAIGRPTSTSTVSHHLDVLVRRGALERHEQYARGLVVLRQPGETLPDAGAKPKPAAAPPRAKHYRLYERTDAGTVCRTTLDKPGGLSRATVALRLDARAHFWGVVEDCTLYQLEGETHRFVAFYPDDRFAAEVWFEAVRS